MIEFHDVSIRFEGDAATPRTSSSLSARLSGPAPWPHRQREVHAAAVHQSTGAATLSGGRLSGSVGSPEGAPARTSVS